MSTYTETALYEAATAAVGTAIAALKRANGSVADLIRNGRDGSVVEAERFEAVGVEPATVAECRAVLTNPTYANRGHAPSVRVIIREAEAAMASASEAITLYEATAGRPWRAWRPCDDCGG